MARPLSYSQLSKYMQCPRLWQEMYVRKSMPFKPTPAMYRGIKIHKQLEDFARSVMADPSHPAPTPLEQSLDKHMPFLRHPNVALKVEERLTTSEDGTGKGKSWVMKLDLVVENYANGAVLVVDHKTGKSYPDHELQLRMYALDYAYRLGREKVAMASFMVDDERSPVVVYDPMDPTTMNECRDFLARMHGEMTRMREESEDLLITPNKFCHWCALHRKNGGFCDGH